jgi:methane/ammonia monooxygenase subunit C
LEEHVTTASTTLPGAAQTPAERKPGYYVKFNLFALAIIGMAVMFVAFRLYQQVFAWNFGLDATSPEFDKYWMTLVKLEIPVLFGAGFICWTYL